MLDHAESGGKEIDSVFSKYGGWREPPVELHQYVILPSSFYPEQFFVGNSFCEGFENSEVVYKFSDSGYYLTWRWKLHDGQWLIEKAKGQKNLHRTTLGISRSPHTAHHFRSLPVDRLTLKNILKIQFAKRLKN